MSVRQLQYHIVWNYQHLYFVIYDFFISVVYKIYVCKIKQKHISFPSRSFCHFLIGYFDWRSISLLHTVIENVNLADITNYSYFSICFFGLLFLVFEISKRWFCEITPVAWRCAGYWEARTSRIETSTKEEVTLFVIANFPTVITYDVYSNKPHCAI